jgi:hypothetical protein
MFSPKKLQGLPVHWEEDRRVNYKAGAGYLRAGLFAPRYRFLGSQRSLGMTFAVA